MRGLRDKQRLVLAGTSEVVSTSSTVKSVLEMIVRNTSQMNRNGLPLFFDHGRNHLRFPEPIDVPASLNYLYQAPLKKNVNFCKFLDSQQEIEIEMGQEQLKLYKYCRDIGQGLEVRTSGLSQECERELEKEIEKQAEQQIQVLSKKPFAQVEWDYRKALFSSSCEDLFGTVFKPVHRFVSRRVKDLSKISWSQSLYCSNNFWMTIRDSKSSHDMSSYMRLVDPMLVFRDGRVVLITLFELDKILPHWWGAPINSAAVASSVVQLASVLNPEQPTFAFEQYRPSTEVLTSLKLFCGIVDYKEEEKVVLKKMFQNVLTPRTTIEALLMKRHRLPHLERSDLEDLL